MVHVNNLPEVVNFSTVLSEKRFLVFSKTEAYRCLVGADIYQKYYIYQTD